MGFYVYTLSRLHRYTHFDSKRNCSLINCFCRTSNRTDANFTTLIREDVTSFTQVSRLATTRQSVSNTKDQQNVVFSFPVMITSAKFLLFNLKKCQHFITIADLPRIIITRTSLLEELRMPSFGLT